MNRIVMESQITGAQRAGQMVPVPAHCTLLTELCPQSPGLCATALLTAHLLRSPHSSAGPAPAGLCYPRDRPMTQSTLSCHAHSLFSSYISEIPHPESFASPRFKTLMLQVLRSHILV